MLDEHSRVFRRRRYLMCPPTHFDVTYSINPWMDLSKPVDQRLAVTQWEGLRDLYVALGHTVELIDPLPGLPDMVFAANGATVVDGRVLGARFRNSERAAEGPAYAEWFRTHGFPEVRESGHVNEGEGDYLVTGRWLLAGCGFRSDPAGHLKAQEFFQRPVVSLTLTDPRYYHLDTALAVLDDDQIMYNPSAFSPGSLAVLRDLFPDALIASEADAAVFGLNAVSDGYNVVLAQAATGLIEQLRAHGFHPIGMDLSELLKAGGGVKCCTQEIRTPLTARHRTAAVPG
ncbi:dimethylargininase [Streptomyces sp. NPDC057002]|uniref:dimethylargininase n=1 Tax=Streptomyces sp. NPDC057002 TaxID=3345992 RepID=UPI0036264056